jgi:hypothetical protein
MFEGNSEELDESVIEASGEHVADGGFESADMHAAEPVPVESAPVPAGGDAAFDTAPNDIEEAA